MRVVRWLAIGSLIGAALTTGTAAHATSAKPPKAVTVVNFSSPRLSVTTSTHRHLKLNVFATKAEMNSTLGVVLEPAHRKEAHEWLFLLKAGSLQASEKTGKGTLKTGPSRLEPYGQVSLTFTPLGKTSTTGCSTTRTVSHRVQVTGTVVFNTHSAGPLSWGSVGSPHNKLRIRGRGSVKFQFGDLACAPNGAKAPCQTGVTWQINNGDVTIFGAVRMSHGKVRSTIEAIRRVTLPVPSKAVRFDEVLLMAPPPALTVKGDKPTVVVTTSGGGASGSAELVSPTPEPLTSHVCATSHDEREAEWMDASYSNGDRPLTLREQIEGKFSVPDQPDNGIITTSTQTD